MEFESEKEALKFGELLKSRMINPNNWTINIGRAFNNCSLQNKLMTLHVKSVGTYYCTISDDPDWPESESIVWQDDERLFSNQNVAVREKLKYAKERLKELNNCLDIK